MQLASINVENVLKHGFSHTAGLFFVLFLECLTEPNFLMIGLSQFEMVIQPAQLYFGRSGFYV